MMRKLLLLIITCYLLLVGSITTYGQTSCQSYATSNNSLALPDIGQSVTMSGCTGGFFHSFTFDKVSSTSGVTATIDIYNGQSDNAGDRIYQQTGTAIMDGTGTATVTFSGGTGTLAFTNNNQYSIILTFSSQVGCSFHNTSTNYGGGSGYSGSFVSSIDIVFDVITTTNNPLPVELTYFNAYTEGNHTELTWQTATEKNNEGFEIHRSTDGKEWQTIGFVQGNSTTQEEQSYTFTDEAPINGTNYYRLKQVDFDGQFEYSSIINVQLAMNNDKIAIFPNPVEDKLTITGGEGIATIYNVLGQPVREFSINNDQLSIDVKDLPKGQYILRIARQNGDVVTEQFVK